MSNFLVMGAGKMGVVLAKDLIDSDPQYRVTLVDISSEQLEQAAEIIRCKRLIPLQRDVEDKQQREEIFEGKDVALCALLHRHSFLTLDAAVHKGVHFVDLVGEGPLERLEYDDEAKKKGIVVISGVGVSPGITNVCVGRAVHLLDETERAIIYVEGNPVLPAPPLYYRIVYAVESLLDFYDRDALILKNGEVCEVLPLSGIETIKFLPPFSEMECSYTDGLNSLLYTMNGRIRDELAEKTIRHKGHTERIETLKACGLFSSDPILVSDQHVIPRRVLEKLLDERIKLGEEQDATLLRIVVSGRKAGEPATHIFEMVDYYDSEKGYTSMAKTTSFPASITAQMVAMGTITKRGVIFPEDIFHAELYEPFINELKKRGVVVTHRIESQIN